MIDSLVFSKGRRRLSAELVAVPPHVRTEGKLRLTKANTRVLCRYEMTAAASLLRSFVRSNARVARKIFAN